MNDSMTPSFIPRGDRFLATIKTGIHEKVIERDGAALVFPSAALAVAGALREIRAIKRRISVGRAVEAKPVDDEDPIVAQWREQRAREQMEYHIQGTLIGIEVVRRKKKTAASK